MSLRRKAVIAAIATAGGLAVPLIAAPSALAAPPTGLTASPKTQTATAGTSATVTATLTGATGFTSPYGVYGRITSGPGAPTPASNTATITCDPGQGATYSCSVPDSVAGTVTVQLFYDAANTAANNGGEGPVAYQSGDPSDTATVVFAGPATSIAITPTTGHAATNSSGVFTITGTDANGQPATGTQTVTITQTTTTSTNPLKFTSPTGTAFPATASGTQTASADTNGGTAYNVTKTITFVNGSATIGVASAVAGTVAVNVGGVNTTTFTAGNATLAVSAGNATPTSDPETINDDRANALTIAAGGTSFTNKTISDIVTVTNAAGDPLGGVTVVGAVTGPNAGATVTATPATTNALGQTTLTYPAGATAGTDTLQAYVNQDTHTVNTAAANPGEPQATTTETIVAEPANLSITSNHEDGITEKLTTTTQSVTYTLKSGTTPVQGLTLDFAIDSGSNPNPNDFTVTPTSGTTDVNGQVTVTVTNPTPVDGDYLYVDAYLNGDQGVYNDDVELDYEASSANAAILSPVRQSELKGATVTETATVDDQFGAAVSGQTVNFVVTGRNSTDNNNGATGSCTTGSAGTCTFSYTDVGTAIVSNNSTDTVTATSNGGGSAATVYYVASTTATTISISDPQTVGVSLAPTSGGTTATTEIDATPRNAGEPLYNTNVTFSSTGVGTFTDADGNPVSSTTVKTDANGNAVIYVRSATTGTQTITAAADGVNESTTVTYTAEYVPVTPVRVADTRTGQGGVYSYSDSNNSTKLAADTIYYFYYGENANIPADEQAYAFNITAIDPSGAGNLRVQNGCNSGVPSTSLINYQKGVTAANFAVIDNNSESNCNDYLTLYSAGSSAAVAIDLVGYYSGGISSITPTRIADTRTGVGGTTGALSPGTPTAFQVAGKAGIPATTDATPAKAVALNITAIGPSGLGNLAIYPDGATKPTASSINYIKGTDKAAFVIVNLPADGKIDVVSNGSSANVAIDAYAYYPGGTEGSHLVTQAPVRILDTRTTTVLAKNTARTVQVSGLAGVPDDAEAVLVSVTAIHAASSTGVGNLRVYPTGSSVPTVSTVNYVSKTSDVANFDIVKLGTGGKISLYSAGSPINVALDVVGYVPAGT